MTIAEIQSLKPGDTVRYKDVIYTIKRIQIRVIWTVIVETSTGLVLECFACELS